MAVQQDFTTGSIPKKMLLFSGPFFAANILQTSYQFIDSIWVGQLLGPAGLGAISISGFVIFTVLSFIIGINSASMSVLSQQKGKNDEEELKKSLNAFVVVLFIMSVFLGIVGFFISDWILTVLNTPESIHQMAKDYLQILFLGIVFMFGYNFISTVLRSLGDSKTPVRFVLVSVILNAILDPLFIWGFDLGIKGAAYATIISQGLAFFYGLIYSLFKANVPFTKPRWPELVYIKTIMKLGIPAGFQMMVISGGMMAIISIVTPFGEQVVAGYGAARQINQLIMIPAFTLGSVVQSMAGQNIGADKWERVNDIAKNGILMILLIMFSISLLLFFAGGLLVNIFVTDQPTIEFGQVYLKSAAFFYPFLGMMFIYNGIIRASGAMFHVLVLNIISFWVIRYPLTLWFANMFGENGIAFGIGISFFLAWLVVLVYYKKGNWKRSIVIEH